MRREWKSALAACGAAAWLVAASAEGMSAEMPAAAVTEALLCDEYHPFAPARTGEIILNSSDFANADGTVILSFVETDSIGNVDVEIVRATPARVVRAISAVPEISAMSPYHGERLKGIKVAVSLQKTKRPVSVVLKLRQVCARHFRNTFLYY